MDFLNVGHVHKRWHELSFFECSGVYHIGDFNLVLSKAFHFDLGLVFNGDKVAQNADGLVHIFAQARGSLMGELVGSGVWTNFQFLYCVA